MEHPQKTSPKKRRGPPSRAAVLRWVLAAIACSGVLAYFPSVCSAVFLALLVLLVPIRPLEKRLAQFAPRLRRVRTAAIAALFLLAACIAPRETAEPAALEAKGWRLCRFLRRTELRASFTVETAQGTKIYEPVDCLWELTFPDGPIRHADGGWYDPASNAIETLRFVYGADGTTAFFEVMDDGQDKQFVFSADGREPAETMDFLRVEPVDA